MDQRSAVYTADDFNTDAHVSPAAALERLKTGNRIYVEALDHVRDLSPARILDLFERGQRPFATVITGQISAAIGAETDPYQASVLNAEATARRLREESALHQLETAGALEIRTAIYHTHCGVVDFL